MISLDLSALLILCLATWRVSYAITTEALPFNIGTRLRNRFPLGGLSTCIFCMSVWVAGAMLVLWTLDGAWYLIVYLFAISGGALVLRSYTGVGIND